MNPLSLVKALLDSALARRLTARYTVYSNLFYLHERLGYYYKNRLLNPGALALAGYGFLILVFWWGFRSISVDISCF